MAFVEDFTPFLDQDQFAEEAQYSAAGSAPAVSVVVIFDLDYQVLLEDLAGGSGPAVHCSVGDVPSAARGDIFTVRGISYEVVEPMADGTGWQTLRLRKV